MSSELKYAVFGSGSWATAIVKILTENNDYVGWWVRNADTVEQEIQAALQHQGPSFLLIEREA